jgi:hypothetical protein
MAMSDLPVPLDGLGYVVIPQYEQEPETVADVLRKAISRPGTFPLLTAMVRMAISLELPTAFPAVDKPPASSSFDEARRIAPNSAKLSELLTG